MVNNEKIQKKCLNGGNKITELADELGLEKFQHL